jgi:hypothetical protein
MRHTIATRVAAGAIGAAAVAGFVAAAPATAWAASGGTNSSATSPTASPTTTIASNPFCTPSTFGQAQQKVETALSGRVTQLSALLSVVDNSSTQLTPGDRQTLQNDISNFELPAVQGLQPQVQQDTTCQQLRGHARAMVFNYRVYVVMTPQTHLTIVADRETAIEQTIVNLEPAINTAILNAQAHGKNVQAAEQAFTDLQNQVSSAQGQTNGQSSQLLSQTPQGYPANWTVFLDARTNLTNARNDLRAAYTDARQIRTDLQ